MEKEKTLKEHNKFIGSLGGKATLKKRGTKHFSEAAKKRWSKIKKVKDK